MSHRERCLPAIFSRILCNLGLIGSSPNPAKISSPEPQPAAPPFSGQKSSDRAHPESFDVYSDPVADKKMPVGFRVRVSVPTNNNLEPFTPVVVKCTPGSGGVQGLQWYSEKLMVDEDGDVAQEFLDEVTSQTSGPLAGYPRVHPSFRLKMRTSPVRPCGQVWANDGNVVQHFDTHTAANQTS